VHFIATVENIVNSVKKMHFVFCDAECARIEIVIDQSRLRRHYFGHTVSLYQPAWVPP